MIARAVVAALAVATGCEARDPARSPDPRAEQMRPPHTEVERILAAPEAFAGSRVTVRGRVEVLHGLSAFTLDGGARWGDDELAVAAREPIRIEGLALRPGEQVIVTGIVRRGHELARRWARAPAIEAAFAPDAAVLEALEVRRTDGYASWTAAPPSS